MKNTQKIIIAVAAVVAVAGAAAFFLFPRASAPNGLSQVLTPRVDRGIEPADDQMLRDRIATKEQEYQDVVAKGENGAIQLLQIGNTYYTLGELDTSVSYYDRILAMLPADAPSLENKGQSLMEMGDYAGAEVAWRKALESNAYDLTYLRLADLFTTKVPDRKAEAKTILEEGIASVGQAPGLLIALGNWYRDQGQLAEAISHYEIASKLDPANAGLLDIINGLRVELSREQLKP